MAPTPEAMQGRYAAATQNHKSGFRPSRASGDPQLISARPQALDQNLSRSESFWVKTILDLGHSATRNTNSRNKASHLMNMWPHRQDNDSAGQGHSGYCSSVVSLGRGSDHMVMWREHPAQSTTDALRPRLHERQQLNVPLDQEPWMQHGQEEPGTLNAALWGDRQVTGEL